MVILPPLVVPGFTTLHFIHNLPINWKGPPGTIIVAHRAFRKLVSVPWFLGCFVTTTH